MPAPFNHSVKTLTLGLIYLATKYRVSESFVTFGKPKPLDKTPTNAADANTYVDVKISERWDVRSNIDGFMYRRLPMSDIVHYCGVGTAPLNYPYTAREILPQLNAIFGLQFQPSDIDDQVIVDSTRQLVLKASAENLAFIGEKPVTVSSGNDTFMVHHPFIAGFAPYEFDEPVPLSTAISSPHLNGFNAAEVIKP